MFDSSGPEGKVRGTPQQIIDKYNQLARDSQLGNDRVATENFQQHAEHYMRLLSEAQREIDARREEQERQNRERQADRDRERAARQENESNPQAQPTLVQPDAQPSAQPLVDDPASAPQPDLADLPQPDVEVDTGLVATPEDKPKPKRTRTRKPKPKPAEEVADTAAPSEGSEGSAAEAPKAAE